MSNLNDILSAYMDNVIMLLRNLVNSVKENNVLLKKNQQLLSETKESLSRFPMSGAGNLSEISGSLQIIVNQLQKGIQSFQLNSILNDIKQIMDNIGISPISIDQTKKDESIITSPITQEFKSGLKSRPKKKDDEEDHLIKPSSFYYLSKPYSPSIKTTCHNSSIKRAHKR